MAQQKHDQEGQMPCHLENSISLGGKMCSGCFTLFEHATGYILDCHRKELDNVNSVQHSIIKALLDFKKDCMANPKDSSEELKGLYRRLARITRIEEFLIEDRPAATNDIRFPMPRPISPTPQVHDKPEPALMHLSQRPGEERSILRPITNLKPAYETNRPTQPCSSKQVTAINEEQPKFRAIISSPPKPSSSPKPTVPTASSKPTSQAPKPARQMDNKTPNHRSFAHSEGVVSLGSTLKSTQSTPATGMVPLYEDVSEIDRKIQELENEQLSLVADRQQMLRVNSPVALHNPARKLVAKTQEGKSLETDITQSQTVDESRRGKKSFDGLIDGAKTATGDATKPSTKKKNMMSLVYKVNTKTLDLDKFDRKKSKASSKLAHDETNTQTNGKSVEHRREQSSASSFFNDELSICYKEQEESEQKQRNATKVPNSIKPLKDLEKLRKSSDLGQVPLDTPHF